MKTIVLTLTKEQKEYFANTGRTGGQTRARNLTAGKRLEIARKASKAAVKARAQRAMEKSDAK